MTLANTASQLCWGCTTAHLMTCDPKRFGYFSWFALTQISKKVLERQHLILHFVLHIIKPNLLFCPASQGYLDAFPSKGGSPPFGPRPNSLELLLSGFSTWRGCDDTRNPSWHSQILTRQNCCPVPCGWEPGSAAGYWILQGCGSTVETVWAEQGRTPHSN